MANIFPKDVWWPKKTVKVMHDKICLMHLSMVCPRMGGATHRKFDIFRFSNVNFHTLGSPFWVKFPPLGRTNIDTHNTQLSISGVYFFLGDEIMVPTISNFVHFPKCRRHNYFSWIFSVAGNLTHILYSQSKYLWIFSHSIYSNVQCQNMTCHHQEELWPIKGLVFVTTVVQHEFLIFSL